MLLHLIRGESSISEIILNRWNILAKNKLHYHPLNVSIIEEIMIDNEHKTSNTELKQLNECITQSPENVFCFHNNRRTIQQ